MKLSLEAREGGTFVFARGDDVVTIQHRAIQPVFDVGIAGSRAVRTANRIREGVVEGAAIGFQMPFDVSTASWDMDDWQAFAADLVHAELLALVATGWEGVTDESGAAFPMSPDAVRTLVIANPDLRRAWASYAEAAIQGHAEGNG